MTHARLYSLLLCFAVLFALVISEMISNHNQTKVRLFAVAKVTTRHCDGHEAYKSAQQIRTAAETEKSSLFSRW